MQTVIPGLVASLVLGCGANVVFDGDQNSGGGGSVDCADVSFDFDVSARICAETEQCSIIGSLEDGRDARIECGTDPPWCALLVEDAMVCSCPADRLDWANTCSNGAPTCAGWRIDYTDALFTCEEDP